MRLLHFTRTPSAVVNILTYGFVYVANPTKTAGFLLPRMPQPQTREPQQFGMVSFRLEHEHSLCLEHRKKYGYYAIAVSRDWAVQQQAKPVRYIGRWSFFAYVFRRALLVASKKLYQELSHFPDDRWRIDAFHNASLAGSLGANEYAQLILAFQYFAPYADRHENEWRIPNPMPVYSISSSVAEAVRSVSPPLGWAIHVNLLKLPKEAVHYLVAPSGQEEVLREYLPEWAKKLPVREG